MLSEQSEENFYVKNNNAVSVNNPIVPCKNLIILDVDLRYFIQ